MIRKDEYKTSRLLYIIEAALEYFISLMVAGAFLAKLVSAIGLSDALTGILTSFVSLGCGFQILAIFFANKKSVKKSVTILHSLNQLFFALIYFVPFIAIPKWAKISVFIALLLAGHALNNIVNSPKINWYMTLVDDRKRGRFTANKEIVSLIGGVAFSILMGAIIDKFEEAGNLNGAMIFCGIGIFTLGLLHTLTLIFSKEKPIEIEGETQKKGSGLKSLLKDKTLLKILVIPVLWSVVEYASTPFYGTYQNKELGFSLVLVSVFSAVGAISRAIFSRPFGKFADKHSFAKLINVCFIIALVAYAVNIFTVPKNGKVLFVIYLVLHSIAMAGINSSMINLIYDFVSVDKRVGALALKSTIAGLAGFLTTLLMSLLVDYIQANGNSLFGVSVYAQQVVSLISVLVLSLTLIYLNLVVKKMKRDKPSRHDTV